MDNRTDDTEDFQSTPEHPPNQVGGPGFSKVIDADVNATPGALRQAILDSEHSEHAVGHELHAKPAIGERDTILTQPTFAHEARTTRPLVWVAIGLAFAVGMVATRRLRPSSR